MSKRTADRTPVSRCRLRGLLGLGLFLALSTAPVQRGLAAELLMFQAAYCEWCERWDEEVGIVYDKTPEARAAPLRRIDMDAPRPADLAGIGSLRFTPTFVLVDRGREIGRILGYPGEAHFWGLLGELLAKLTPTPST